MVDKGFCKDHGHGSKSYLMWNAWSYCWRFRCMILGSTIHPVHIIIIIFMMMQRNAPAFKMLQIPHFQLDVHENWLPHTHLCFCLRIWKWPDLEQNWIKDAIFSISMSKIKNRDAYHTSCKMATLMAPVVAQHCNGRCSLVATVNKQVVSVSSNRIEKCVWKWNLVN